MNTRLLGTQQRHIAYVLEQLLCELRSTYYVTESFSRLQDKYQSSVIFLELPS